MKKNLVITSICICAFIMGLSINYVKSDVPANYKVGVVDVAQVIENSKQVDALKKDQQKKFIEIKAFIEKAQADIAKQTDEKKRKELEDKYNKELSAKRDVIEKDYAKKLKAIDNNINEEITKQAKANNFDLVLVKGIVIYGGEDITEAVKAKVK